MLFLIPVHLHLSFLLGLCLCSPLPQQNHPYKPNRNPWTLNEMTKQHSDRNASPWLFPFVGYSILQTSAPSLGEWSKDWMLSHSTQDLPPFLPNVINIDDTKWRVAHQKRGTRTTSLPVSLSDCRLHRWTMNRTKMQRLCWWCCCCCYSLHIAT